MWPTASGNGSRRCSIARCDGDGSGAVRRRVDSTGTRGFELTALTSVQLRFDDVGHAARTQSDGGGQHLLSHPEFTVDVDETRHPAAAPGGAGRYDPSRRRPPARRVRVATGAAARSCKRRCRAGARLASSDIPATVAWLQGTTTCRGGAPSTERATSDASQPTSRATIARTAPRRASGDDPISRLRSNPASDTPRSTSRRCPAPAQMTRAPRPNAATWRSRSRPSPAFHSASGVVGRAGQDHDVGSHRRSGAAVPDDCRSETLDRARLQDVERLPRGHVAGVVDQPHLRQRSCDATRWASVPPSVPAPMIAMTDMIRASRDCLRGSRYSSGHDTRGREGGAGRKHAFRWIGGRW